ncbi:MAG: hypothetical protein QNK98_16475 [Yoonia sp.]
MSKSIVFVTGTRADFGKLAPLAVAERDQGFAVSFFVTGMHMLEQYGLTKIQVQRMEGVEVHEFLNQRAGDLRGSGRSLGLLIGLRHKLHPIRPHRGW